MTLGKRLGWLPLALVLGSPLALWGAGNEVQQPKTPVARVEVQPTRVDWLPLSAFERLELRVAGPEGIYIEKELGAGEAPSFSLDGPDGRLPDGIYAYELRAAKRQKESLVQSGHLWIQGGRFAEPAAAKPDPTLQDNSGSKPPIRNITAQDTVIPDNLVVEGRACIGNDCEPGDGDDATAPLLIKDFGIYQIKFDALNAFVPWERQWALQANEPGADGDFLIRDLSHGTIPFRIGENVPDNALTILYNGNIGLGTLTPAQKLHVLGSNGATQALIEETNATTADRTLVTLKNKGGIRLNYVDTSTNTTWGNNLIGGNYRILKAGAGVVAFELQGNGNLTIAGTLTQNSDRTTKHDIVPVQPNQILDKALSLPIATWVRNGDEAKHLGPMAQDFAAAFGLGEDDRHIAIIDMAGVSLASIQALNGRMDTAMARKDAELETLRRENSALASRVEALEKLVSGLVQATAEVPLNR